MSGRPEAPAKTNEARHIFSRRKLLAAGSASFLLQPFMDAIEARADGPNLDGAFFTMYKGQCQYGGASKPDTFDVAARNWVPTMDAGAIKLSPVLQPFEKIKQYMTFAIGLDIATSPKDVHWTPATLFTGDNHKNKDNLAGSNNESLDYYVARRMGKGEEPLVVNPYSHFTGGEDAHMLSWGRDSTGKTFKKRPYSDPVKLFSDVFGGGLPVGAGTDAAKEAAIQRAKQSMLDAIRADAARIKARTSAEHRAQIDLTLDGVRALETNLLGKNGKPTDGFMETCMAPQKLTSFNAGVFDSEAALETNWGAIIDITLAALRCGLRSTFSFQFMDAACNLFVPAKLRPAWRHATFGVTGYHFEHCHFPNGNTWIECERYIYGHFARLLEGMAKIPAGTTNLLEKSLGVFASSQSHNHFVNAASFFTVGNAGARLKSGRIMTYGNPYTNANSGKPHSDLLVSVLQAWGYTDVKSYGDPSLCHGGLAGFVA